MSCKVCEKMLHTLFKAESCSDSLVFANSTYQRHSAFFFPVVLRSAQLIWTTMSLQIAGVGIPPNMHHTSASISANEIQSSLRPESGAFRGRRSSLESLFIAVPLYF